VTGLDSPPCRITVAAAPREHTGLGTGTQLGLAVARAIAELEGRPTDLRDLCERSGRGRRSGIGAHGFELGGFLADGGKPDGDHCLAPLVARLAAPEAWRWVIALPAADSGLSGRREEAAFAALAREAPAEASSSAEMARLLLLGLIPALAEADFAAFSAALREYGDRAGESFRRFQGGLFASPRAAALVAFARERGSPGAGQSSWGPAVHAPVPDEEAARGLAAAIRKRFGEEVEVAVARARNRGAAVEATGGAPSAHTIA
jgi:beta-RFAP synthase